MAVATCPKSETLAAFARGDLTTTELASVAEHVGACEACCRALQLVPEDTLAGLARAAAAAPLTVVAAAPPAEGTPGVVASGKVPTGFVDHSRYRIISELGVGGMGTVYKADDLAMGRVVALKVVSPHLTAKASAVGRFRREIHAAAQLEHPNIIRAYDTGEAGGAQYLVMEFVEGTSLDRLVAKKGPLPVPMACAFMRHAALGLQHAADKGMTHRDIKPQNLMVTRKGQVKILDFGIARFAHTDEETDAPGGRLPFGAGKATVNTSVTNPNLLMGTPDYLSPEQAKNSHDVDPRSDIYSLGCTLYYLLTGKAPFAGADTLIDKLVAHTEDAPPPIREQRFEVTEGLAEVLAKMMAKKPADRYQTAKEAADALHPHTRTTGAEPVFEVVELVVVPPAPLVATLVVAPKQALDTDAEHAGPTLAEVVRPKKKTKKRATWWSRRKWAVLGGAAALLLLLGIVATTGMKPGSDKHGGPNAGDNAKVNPKGPQGGPKGKGDKGGNPSGSSNVVTPNTGEKKRGVKVLYVLPSNGVWLHDYTDVRKRLEEMGATVVTASTDGGSSRPHADLPGPSVPVDKYFTATMDLSEYSAVVFTGANSDEYMFVGKGSVAAAKVIQRMQNAGKPVAAICVGQSVLVAHGVLKGKRAAECPPLRQKHPFLTNEKSGITWDGPGVTVDGLIVTASGGRESVQFADTLLKLIEGK